MEAALYQEVYNTVSELKSTTTLGAFVTFLHQEIMKKHPEMNYDIISDRTLERGFKTYLEPEILQKFKKFRGEKDEQKNEKPYEPSLKTLNLLAEYLGFKDYAEFSYSVIAETKGESSLTETNPKITFTVNQYGNNNKSVRKIKTNNFYL